MHRATPIHGLLRGLAVLLLTLLAVGCGPSYTLVSHQPAAARLDETFPYRKWLRPGAEPDIVVIGIHGFCGASLDYENLARHLLRDQPRTAVYAYEVRGQGRDPLKERRGDIDDPANWSRDLHTFTDLVRREHPGARIVWFGESMGALILAEAYRNDIDAGRRPPCDALALSSPVVDLPDDFPDWKKNLVLGIAALAPDLRVPIETLSGGQPLAMTHDTIHSDQAELNAWHVEKHTLRLLGELGGMIDRMPANARRFHHPSLVLHGGHDILSEPDDVRHFVDHIPASTPRERRFYPEGHHLLMYDHVKEQVFDDVADWLDELRRRR